MKTHEIKILPQYFELVCTPHGGIKRFELRKDDRDYQAGDSVTLREWTVKSIQVMRLLWALNMYCETALNMGLWTGTASLDGRRVSCMKFIDFFAGIGGFRLGMEMAEQYKLALFGVIRNSKVMPAGMRLGKNMQEINKMSVETMHEVIEMCDFERLREFYKEDEQE